MRRYATAVFSVLLIVVTAGGCEQLTSLGAGSQAVDTTRAPGVPPPGEGLVTTPSARSVEATTRRLKKAIQASEASLIADIDHAQRAASAGGSLQPMRLLLLGAPALGTPLMQDVSAVGVDLPQKVLVWQGPDDSTHVTYNAPAYLQARHDLSGVDAPLARMGTALAALTEQAAGHAPDTLAVGTDSIAAGAGLVIETSDFGFEDTFDRLQNAVQDASQFSVVARVDHAQNAVAAGDSLRPMRLLMVGPAEAGTAWMERAPTLGIDLPHKMLVYQHDEGPAFIVYDAPAYLARRHALTDTTGLARMTQQLKDLAFEATSDEAERREVQEAERDTTGVAY